ncbi:MAG: hypothetical protein N2253_06965 [Bacteroidia bacterium]|nr:hypothetical protein [Bacteroidia bacterium]MCX7764613.1 hypothetical protein [Bacteroidia bacterium]
MNKSRRRLYDSLRAKVLIRFLQEEGIQTIVVGVQFAESERSEPLPSQRKIALDLCNMGRIEGVVFYPKGLRDLLAWRTSFFDQIHQEAVRQAYILRLYFYRRRLLQIEPDFFT